MDFSVILPIADAEKQKEWKTSKLSKIIKYICEQL